MKKQILFVLFIFLICLTACGEKKDTDMDNSKTISTRQIDGPKKGDTVAEFNVKYYDSSSVLRQESFSVVLFPEAAPKAVENFVTHAKEGYYDGVLFHRVIYDFMIQSGDPTGTGRGGESIWGSGFENEINENFLPIRGALGMAYAEADSNGSQFFVVTCNQCNEEYLSELSDSQKERFREYNGASWLAGLYTVFGQVYEGMDIVDAISEAETDTNDRPLEDVVIESIKISEVEN